MARRSTKASFFTFPTSKTNIMAIITRNASSSHWYHRDGTACHEIIAKSSGLPRPTTVKDARVLNLVPSVTSVIGIKAKPGLDIWKQDNAIMAALSTPRNPSEEEKDWHSRIAEESNRIGREAAEWGTLIHEQCEQFCRDGAFLGTGEILDYVAGYADWHRENVIDSIHVEKSVVGELGYAGRLDLYAMVNFGGVPRRAVIDYKSQKLKGKPKGAFYKEWEIQLAAYGDCLREEGEEMPVLISVIIPSDAPGPVQTKVWENPENALKAFHACHALWCYEKGYEP